MKSDKPQSQDDWEDEMEMTMEILDEQHGSTYLKNPALGIDSVSSRLRYLGRQRNALLGHIEQRENEGGRPAPGMATIDELTDELARLNKEIGVLNERLAHYKRLHEARN